MSKYRSDKRLEDAALKLKALGHPHRLRIYLRLAACCSAGDCCGTEAEYAACVGELGKNLGVAPSTLSHHIKELRQAGLIHVERNGQRMTCDIDTRAISDLRDLLNELDGAAAAKG